MRLLALLAPLLLLLPTGAASPVTTPSYWEGAGHASWTLRDANASNHGGSIAAMDCVGELRIRVFGPTLRYVEVGAPTLPTITYGDQARHGKYDVRVDVQPTSPGCEALHDRFDSTHQGLDLIDESFGCVEDDCFGATLEWTPYGSGLLAIRTMEGAAVRSLEADIGVTFRLG